MVDKRAMILDVAEELIGEHGYEGTSIRMLANKAGVNVAMISYYFGSKEKLFEALVEERTRFVRERLQYINSNIENPWERIEMAVEAYVDRIFTHHRFHRILFREISLQQRSVMSDNIVELLFKNVNEFTKIIRDGQEQGVFRNVDVELTIASITGTISKIVLSCKFSCRMFGGNTEESEDLLFNDTNKVRLKAHLKDFVTVFLKPN